MNSIQTKSKSFVRRASKCIAQVVAVAEPGGFRIYVAWEWEEMAEKGVFGIVKSSSLYLDVSPESINDAANYGWDISETAEAQKIFSNLF